MWPRQHIATSRDPCSIGFMQAHAWNKHKSYSVNDTTQWLLNKQLTRVAYVYHQYCKHSLTNSLKWVCSVCVYVHVLCVVWASSSASVREDTVQSHPHNNSPHLLYTTLHTQARTQIGTYRQTRVYVYTHPHIPHVRMCVCVCTYVTLMHTNTNMWCMSHCTQWKHMVRLCAHTSIPTVHGHMCTCTNINTHHTTNRGPMYMVEGDNSVCCYCSSVILYIASMLVISLSALCTVHTGVHMHP